MVRELFRFGLIVLTLGISTAADAAKTYTPEQLTKLVSTGRYPRQGNVTTQVKIMDYAACIAALDTVINAIKPRYPAQTIASTNMVRSEKVWTNDSAMTVTCEAITKKQIITTAPYL